MFSPVEIRNPASSSSASRSTSKAKTSTKESSSKKGKKKANVGTGSIEEVAGRLSVGVSKSSTLVEQDPVAEPGPSTRDQVASEKKNVAAQNDEDNDDDMYATEEDGYGDKGGDDGALEANADGQGEGVGANPDLPPQKKRKPTRKGKGKSVARPIKAPTTTGEASKSTTPAMVVELNIAQGQHQQSTPPTGDDIPMAIDPALEALQAPNN